MKIEYRARRAHQEIREMLNYKYECMADLAINHLGQSFNVATGWELKGEIEGLRSARKILINNSIYE
jgi:hypothetical protein